MNKNIGIYECISDEKNTEEKIKKRTSHGKIQKLKIQKIACPDNKRTSGTIIVHERIIRDIEVDTRIRAYFRATPYHASLLSFDREDTIASEEDSIPYLEKSFASTIIIGTLDSSTEIHFFTRSDIHDISSRMFRFIGFAEV